MPLITVDGGFIIRITTKLEAKVGLLWNRGTEESCLRTLRMTRIIRMEDSALAITAMAHEAGYRYRKSVLRPHHETKTEV
jgi:hypothetical protein